MSEKLNVVIVDDQQASVSKLRSDLIAYEDIEISAVYTDSRSCLLTMASVNPDVIFLDIEMPDMTGIELLQKVRPELKRDVSVIFYTAYDKYMIQAIRSSAFDYLLKPYKKDELDIVGDRLRNKLSGNITANCDFAGLDNQITKKFAIQTINGLLLVKNKDLRDFEYLPSRCWQLKTVNSGYHRLKMNTKAEDILSISKDLIQVRQGIIINSEYLSSIDSISLKCNLFCSF